MSDHNPKPMNKEELEKYIEKDFLPSLLSKFPNIVDLVAENARIKAEVERLSAMANENAHLHKGIYSLSLNVVQLKDEVERLTNLKSGADYLKAEEGKQS